MDQYTSTVTNYYINVYSNSNCLCYIFSPSVCEEVVIPRIHPIVDEDICLKCDCQYEIRNSWLIKVWCIRMCLIVYFNS